MSASDLRSQIYLRLMNQRYGEHLEPLPRASWPAPRPGERSHLIEAWRSRDFLVMVFREDTGYVRLSVVRTALDAGRYADGISWDDLQRLKAETGRAACWAVEVYPPAADVVNVQNMRHLFVLEEPPPYAWRRGEEDR
jgi:hypothetical protein